MKNLILIITLVATSAFAANQKIDVSKSYIQWEGAKVSATHTGKIFYKNGFISTAKDSLTGGKFTVNMETFTNEDLTDKGYNKKFVGHMKSGDFFDVTKHPESTLTIKSVKNGAAVADLTIKGKTNEVKFPITKKGNGYTGKLVFDRTKWGIKYGSGIIGTVADKIIKDEVTLTFNLVLANK